MKLFQCWHHCPNPNCKRQRRDWYHEITDQQSEGTLDAFRKPCSQECEAQITTASAPNENVSRNTQKEIIGWEVGRNGMSETPQAHRENEGELPTWWLDDEQEVSSGQTLERFKNYVFALASEEESF